MEAPTAKFLHVADLGLQLQESTKRRPSRQTLIARGRLFAESNGLRIFTVGRDAYVSTAELTRLHHGEAAA